MSSNTDPATKKTSPLVRFCHQHGFSPVSFISILVLVLVVLTLVAFIIISKNSVPVYDSRTIDFGLQDIGELATQAGYYTNVNMITNPNRTIAGIPMPGTSSKAIMTYQGTIKAGIDFDQIQVNIDDEEKLVSLALPAPRILSNEIDLNSFEKFDENNSIFNPINVENYNQSLIEMKTKAETQAIENGILDAAKSNAEVLIQSMFKNVDGAEEYKLQFNWPKNEKK